MQISGHSDSRHSVLGLSSGRYHLRNKSDSIGSKNLSSKKFVGIYTMLFFWSYSYLYVIEVLVIFEVDGLAHDGNRVTSTDFGSPEDIVLVLVTL